MILMKVFFVMVDLKYSQHLHDAHNNFPLAAEKMKIDISLMSTYQKSLPDSGVATEKLMETLFDKSHYVCHYSILKFFVQQGLQVTKLHKTLHFRQTYFLKPYVDLNTSLRQQPGISDFKKNFFKLLVNSCFGKSMENLRRRKQLIVVTNEEQAIFYCNKLNFNRFKIFKENMVAVTMMKKSILWNKPTYHGAAILDLSKLHLYQFHYEKNVPMYGS